MHDNPYRAEELEAIRHDETGHRLVPPELRSRPIWVELGMKGVRSRRTARIWIWVYVALAVALMPLGVIPGLLFFGVALFFFLTVRWVDRHDAWPK